MLSGEKHWSKSLYVLLTCAMLSCQKDAPSPSGGDMPSAVDDATERVTDSSTGAPVEEIAPKQTAPPSEPLRPKVVDEQLLASILGEYRPLEQADRKSGFFDIRIDAEKVRCNDSNFKSEYSSYSYAVAFANDGTVALWSMNGALLVKFDSESGRYSFNTNGLCTWGVKGGGAYERVSPLEGTPTILLPASTTVRREPVSAVLGEELTLPGGTLMLADVKRDKWTGDDGTADVVALRFSVRAPEDAMIDPFLALDLSNIISTEGLWNVSCRDVDSRKMGSPQFNQHRQPAFDNGYYSSFGGHRQTLLKPGTTRNGWVTLLMTGRPEGECSIKYDAVALGAGVVTWKTAFE